MSHLPIVENAAARRHFMARHALSGDQPAGSNRRAVQSLVERLGFVQVDSVNTLARAHDLILYSRLRRYQPGQLRALVDRDRTLFENWTHDAAIIPSVYFPYWQRGFERHEQSLRQKWRKWRREGFEAEFDRVLAHVGRHGAVRSRDLGSPGAKGDGWWDWHPSKTALEFLWRTGKLAICRREGFQKVYDLTERVLPTECCTGPVDDPTLIDWACRSALDRLGFATPGELAAFWALISPAEAKAWCGSAGLEEVAIEPADGGPPRRSYVAADLLATAPPEPSGSIRVLSPFDPMIRNRNRTSRLFGFDYRIEIFVPAERRRFGYYVFPLLERDRLIGRVDMKADRERARLDVTALWPEPGITFGKGRMARLEAELHRLCRFTGLIGGPDFANGWLRPSKAHFT